VKVLFFMRHPGYVRNFESAMAEMAERGHRVHVAFDRYFMRWQPDRNPIDPLCARYPAITHGPSPAPARSVSVSVGIQLGVLADYLRYFGTEYTQAPKLRQRARTAVPSMLREPIDRVATSGARRRLLARVLADMERAAPVPDEVAAYIRGHSPDLVIVTPLVGLGSPQVQYLRAAKLVGCPTVLAVASWDNLTNKGLIRGAPDWVTVWNEAQRREAVDLHGMEPGRVVATGAQSYDHWFSWRPSTTREEFCAMVGLDPAQSYLLFLGSSPFIAEGEADFALRWGTTLRARDEPEVRDVGILIRPHPQNSAQYADVDFSALGNVTVWPRGGADPVDRDAKSGYYDSIHHSVGVVGINTSALIESAIIGRRVHTLLSDDFAGTQAGTLHFAHIADDESGFVHIARTFEDHVAQLREAITSGPAVDQRARAFVRRFVRPQGLDAPATSYVVDAFESAASSKPGPPEDTPPAARMALLTATSAVRLFRVNPRRLIQKRLDHLVLGHPRLARAGRAVRERARRKPLAETTAAARQPSHRLLFFLNYPGYLRYFDRTIAELADRGYEVLLVFDRPEMQKEGLEAISGFGDRVRVVDRAQRRRDVWGAVARGLRVSGDYARYLQPRFRDAHYLRDRRRKGLNLPHAWRFLSRLPTLPEPLANLLQRSLLLLERAIPSSSAVERFIVDRDPDAVIVTPLVSGASPQTDVVKSACALGVPVAVCIASWDHLTTKGIMRVVPDRVIVWNETQAGEARDLHRVSAERIAVTGAQPFDRWFERRPSTSRSEFCAKVGLPDDRPYVLFVGSTAGISRPDDEYRFVRRWIQVLRESGDARLREAGILIRPHPYNPGGWADADVSGLGPVAVWPRAGANPVNDDDRADYFDSMYHAAAVVGINTSAMIESAIVGRPVHTIRTSAFTHSQAGTLHFQYLLPENGGFLRVATTLDAHANQLANSLAEPERAAAELSHFIAHFVRPLGLERPCVPIVADELERLARSGRHAPETVPVWLLPLTAILALVGLRRRYARPAGVGRDVYQAARRVRARLDITADQLEGIGVSGRRLRAAGRRVQGTGRLVDIRLRQREQMSGNGAKASEEARALAVDD
jgi:hypothetical protein